MRLKLIAIAVAVLCLWPISASAQTDKTKPYVVAEKWFKPPKQAKYIKGFRPWHNPTVAQIHKIDKWESEKWGGPSLLNRMWCESGYRPKVSNGTYGGLLQYNYSYWPGIWETVPRRVVVVVERTRPRAIVRFRKWSHIDGWIRKETNHIRQKVWIVYKGVLPENADPTHGWAAIRAGARTVGGYGPPVSWECGL
jgi:hypothetical protein